MLKCQRYDNNVLSVIARIISYMLGACFIISGVAKILDVATFSDEIAQYADYYIGVNKIIEYRKFFAIFLCIVEIFLGILSFVMVRGVFLSAVCSLLFLLFVFITGTNLFTPPNGVGVASCGCFGKFLKLSTEWSFVKSLALLILSLIRFWILFKHNVDRC